jgi:uncharacterized DUF497 family protein
VTDDIYASLAECDGFDWDDGNAPKVRARHGVEPGECEQAFFGAPLLVSADLKHSLTETRWRALGMTLGGRAIYLVFTLRGSKIRVLAARNMNRKERRDYEQAQARAEEDSDV